MTRPATTTATADIAALGAAHEDETLTIDFIPAVETLEAVFGTYGSLWTIYVNFGDTYIHIDAITREQNAPSHPTPASLTPPPPHPPRSNHSAPAARPASAGAPRAAPPRTSPRSVPL